MMRRTVAITFLALFALFASTSAYGQAVYGNIVGTVTDSSGAAVPNAKVTITDTNRGVSVNTTTNESGNFSQRFLIVGRYQVRVEAQGFKVTVTEVCLDAEAEDVRARLDDERAAELVPELPEVWYTLASARSRTDDQAGTDAAYEEALHVPLLVQLNPRAAHLPGEASHAAGAVTNTTVARLSSRHVLYTRSKIPSSRSRPTHGVGLPSSGRLASTSRSSCSRSAPPGCGVCAKRPSKSFAESGSISTPDVGFPFDRSLPLLRERAAISTTSPTAVRPRTAPRPIAIDTTASGQRALTSSAARAATRAWSCALPSGGTVTTSVPLAKKSDVPPIPASA